MIIVKNETKLAEAVGKRVGHYTGKSEVFLYETVKYTVTLAERTATLDINVLVDMITLNKKYVVTLDALDTFNSAISDIYRELGSALAFSIIKHTNDEYLQIAHPYGDDRPWLATIPTYYEVFTGQVELSHWVTGKEVPEVLKQMMLVHYQLQSAARIPITATLDLYNRPSE